GLIIGALRRRVDGADIPVEQLNWRRGRGSHRGGRGPRDQMQFGAIIAPAEIAEQPRQLCRRPEAPAIVVNALSGEIGGIVAEAAAIFGGRAAAPERAALTLAFEPLVIEAIL